MSQSDPLGSPHLIKPHEDDGVCWTPRLFLHCAVGIGIGVTVLVPSVGGTPNHFWWILASVPSFFMAVTASLISGSSFEFFCAIIAKRSPVGIRTSNFKPGILVIAYWNPASSPA